MTMPEILGPAWRANLVAVAVIMLAVWNMAVFLLYAADKRRAEKGRRRIPERTLLTCAFLLGGAGAALGMVTMRHKTRHWNFRILVPLALVLQAGLLVWLWSQWIRQANII